MTPARFELGRKLFYSKQLSLNQTQSCSSCHIQAIGFTDGKTRAQGSTGKTHPRNAQGLANVGYLSRFTWFNSELNRLENQALVPLFSEETPSTIPELAITGQEHTIAARLRADADVVRLFEEAYGTADVDVIRIAKSLAVFQTAFVSYRSPYDRGEMSEQAKRGEALFRSAKTGCAGCHGGWNFNEDQRAAGASYVNIGLYNVGGRGDYPDHALHGPPALKQTQGLFIVTENPLDRGKFRIPSLRNAAVTGPYMHDGSVATLEEVIEHFNQGGRSVAAGAFSGDGRANPNKDPRVRPLGLSTEEKSDLAEFLRSLTDDCFLNDPRFSDPDGPLPRMPAHCG